MYTKSSNKLAIISTAYPTRGVDIHKYVEEQVSITIPHPVIHISAPPGTQDIINDLGLVICNFGDNELRRTANNKALRWTLASKPQPYIVLVDAQHEGIEHHYNNYADDRVFILNKTIPDKSKGMFIKEALWNIGAKYLLEQNLGITKLVFLDMDIEFVDQMWASEVSKSLDIYDVISPHMANYYAENDGTLLKGLRASMGYNQTLDSKLPGFQGMSFGCTVDFYTNRLNSEIKLISSCAGDTYLWYDIAGKNSIFMVPTSIVTRYNPDRDISGMLPKPKIGHGSQIIAHRDHGSKNTRAYMQRMALLKRCNYGNFDDYVYDENGMPEWADNNSGKLMSRIFGEVVKKANTGNPCTTREVMDLYEQEAVDIYGPITPIHPLVVVCVLRSGGIYTGKHVRWLKKQFECNCLTPFTFICLSDVDIKDVITVPLELSVEEARGSSVQIEQYKNIWPINASILTCDLDTVICRPFLPHRCPENSFFMLREHDNWYRGDWVMWNSGLTYFRGDFSFLFDYYKQHISGTPQQHPRYMCVGAQEFLTMALRIHGIYPESIEPHFCTRYWNNDTKRVDPETAILSFPDTPKPWDLQRYSFIPPLCDN